MDEDQKQHHPAVQEILTFFEYSHLSDALQEISKPCHDMAHDMADDLEGAELTVGLRKLLEAKDCFVRAAIRKAKR